MNEEQNELQSELIVGLVGAVGTELSQVVDLLTERIKLAGYEVRRIKVSDEVIPIFNSEKVTPADPLDRIDLLMRAGNRARENAKDNSILALGVADAIYQQRPKGKSEKDKGKSIPASRTAFIIDSLKRPEEVTALRNIYPSGFILIGVHSEESRRLTHLTKNLGISVENAKDLIERDGEERQVPYGQRLNRTFHLADFFVRITENRERLRHDIKRMVEIWFGNPFTTPTFDEFAMFMAFSAALRSADLSRQVGAVIAKDYRILSTGANDCPMFNGGLYWPERDETFAISDVAGGRDYTIGYDSNRVEQNRIIEEIVSQCSEKGIDPGVVKKILQDSRVADLTEFGRVVHAEMEAILACGRSGVSTVNATLYSTTFPCHNCAKHIVAAGLTRAVYVEPYPKSKAIEFHKDSITTDPEGDRSSKVRFVPFVGIGPRRYFDLFSMNTGASYPLVRKDPITGAASTWSIDRAKLRIKMLPDSYLGLELEAVEKFRNNLKE